MKIGEFGRILIVSMLAFVITLAAVVVNSTHKRELDDTLHRAIGHPVEYTELPSGEWRVVTVVNELTGTVVIHKQTLAVGYTTPESQEYLLVTGVLPSLAKQGVGFKVP